MEGPALHRVEVTPKALAGLQDTRGESVKRQLAVDHGIHLEKVRSITGYHVKADLSDKQLERMVSNLFCDPVIEHGSVNQAMLNDPSLFPKPPDMVIQIGFKPGVTDNAAQAGLDGLRTLGNAVEDVGHRGRHFGVSCLLGKEGS